MQPVLSLCILSLLCSAVGLRLALHTLHLDLDLCAMGQCLLVEKRLADKHASPNHLALLAAGEIIFEPTCEEDHEMSAAVRLPTAPACSSPCHRARPGFQFNHN